MTISTRGRYRKQGLQLKGLLPDKTERYQQARTRVMGVCGLTTGKLRRQMLRKPAVRADRSVLCPGKVHTCNYERNNKNVGNKRRGFCKKYPKKKK